MTTIAFLGPSGTFTHQVTLAESDLTEELVCASVDAVVDAVASGEATAGIIPIENSVDGVVTAHLDRLVFHADGVFVHAERVLDITFDALVSKDTPLDAPRNDVRSHPVALAQCSNWVTELNASPTPAPSTAAACEIAASTPGVIALASPAAAARYNLRALARDVGDHKGAQTKFWRLGRSLTPATPASSLFASSTYATTLVLIPEHDHVGVLAEILSVFALRSINLSHLSVRPLKYHLGQYCFILTLRAGLDDPALRDAISEVFAARVAVKVLGSYPIHPAPLRAVVPEKVPGVLRNSAELAQFFASHVSPVPTSPELSTPTVPASDVAQ